MGSLTSQVLGNLTADIEVKSTQSGTSFIGFTIAVNHDKESTSFVRCAAWGKTAETIAKFFHKGDQIFVSGIAKINEWEDKQGNKRKEFEVQVNNFSFVTSKSDRPIAQHEVLDKAKDFAPTDLDDKPIDLSEIPF